MGCCTSSQAGVPARSNRALRADKLHTAQNAWQEVEEPPCGGFRCSLYGSVNSTLSRELDISRLRETSKDELQQLFKTLDAQGSIHELNLQGTPIEEDVAEQLSLALESCSSVRFLLLSYTSMKPAVLAKALQSNDSLELLDLSGNDIGDNGAMSLSQVLSSNNSLKKLHLAFNSISAVGGAFLARALNGISESSLELLDLSQNRMRYEGATILAQALCSNTRLRQLDLCGNSIGSEGAEALADALCSNGGLEQLNLRSDGIGPAGAFALAEALRVNKRLQQLDISGNSIGDEGTVEVARALASNKGLRQLHLMFNEIGDVGAEALANALPLNGVLKQLDLCANSITAKGICLLADALHENRKLKQLDVRENALLKKDMLALQHGNLLGSRVLLA